MDTWTNDKGWSVLTFWSSFGSCRRLYEYRRLPQEGASKHHPRTKCINPPRIFYYIVYSINIRDGVWKNWNFSVCFCFQVKVDDSSNLEHVTRTRPKGNRHRRPPTRIHMKEVFDWERLYGPRRNLSPNVGILSLNTKQNSSSQFLLLKLLKVTSNSRLASFLKPPGRLRFYTSSQRLFDTFHFQTVQHLVLYVVSNGPLNWPLGSPGWSWIPSKVVLWSLRC